MQTEPKRRSTAKQLGAVLQGLVLGALLTLALWELALMESGASVFQYQGY